MADLAEIEAIKRLKYKYFRCLDCKQWDEMAQCFTEDAVTSYSGGKYAFEGRDTIMGFLAKGLGSHMISMHHGHHPEIELTSETTATGIWALQDYVIDLKHNTSLMGAAFYRDEYVKMNGEWKIKYTGYERTFEEISSRADTPSLKLLQQMFGKPEE
jgi:hypothetical protein